METKNNRVIKAILEKEIEYIKAQHFSGIITDEEAESKIKELKEISEVYDIE
jgi:pyruvate/oxaloacetate carboxyltransferase